jgi:uncharacterized protein YcbK (DUF882 family)
MNNHITANFTWSEFACHNGIWVPNDLKSNVTLLCEQLEVIRKFINAPICVVCGYRTEAYNRELRLKDSKVAFNSQHCLGKAADIQNYIENSLVFRNQILHLFNIGAILQGGLGLYDTFVHYDIRGVPARWDYSTKY